MMGIRQSWTGARGFLARLVRDTRGNTLAIMTIALIPLAGLIGGGLDIGRMYIVKTRLQHACDAGALAGRKAMGGGVWVQTVNGVANYPNTTAERFFDANYNSQAYGVTSVTKSFSENAGKVNGTASAVLPMTLMRIFGRTDETLTVVCDAEMRLPNTDVMFVLDVTGSMNDKVVATDTQTKIQALRSAVKCFYEIVARLDTGEPLCTGESPSGGVGDEVQVRFGFVPYDMNVNVGGLLPPDYFVDNWTYQSRENIQISGVAQSYVDGNKSGWSAWSNKTATTATSAECQSTYGTNGNGATGVPKGGKNEANGGVEDGGTWDADTPWNDWERTFTSWSSGANNCKYKQRTRTYNRTFTYREVPSGTAGAVVFNLWRYKPIARDVSVLKNGTAWTLTRQYTAPARTDNNATTQTYTWGGCIEERATVRASNYYPIDANAHDLQIDEIPSTWSDATRWAPALDGFAFPRRVDASNTSAYSTDTIRTFTNYTKSWDCPTAARKLQEWPDASTFGTYVDSIWGGGNTYHDIGLVWGARLMSPTGMFRSENEFTPEGGEIQRHMIFMTDGEACTSEVNYQAYGLAWWDRRQTDPNVGPTSGCQTTGTLTQQVNARTAALCKAIQNRNITLWVIWFGESKPTIEGQLRTCAQPNGRFMTARNPEQLQNTFRSIATEISQLRLTK